MSDLPESQPIEPAPTPKRRSAQDKKMENDLIATGQLIAALQAETEAAPELAEGGYTAEELTRALGVQQAAFAAYLARTEADAAQVDATAAFKAADKAARAAYKKLRGLAKSAFLKNPAGRVALRLEGREPTDLQNFIAAAETLAAEGQKPLQADALQHKGVTTVKLQDLQTKVAALKAADQAQNAAIQHAPRTTTLRDAALKELNDWLVEFKAFARAQFVERPDLLKRWGVK